MAKTLMTAEETAKYLKVRPATIRKWTMNGYIPHIKVGGAVRYDLDKIDAWLEKRAQAGRLKQGLSASEEGARLKRRDPSKPPDFNLD